MSAVKVLLAGDCLGGFAALFKKVAAVNAKNGPFDLLLCVGQFFEPGGALVRHGRSLLSPLLLPPAAAAAAAAARGGRCC